MYILEEHVLDVKQVYFVGKDHVLDVKQVSYILEEYVLDVKQVYEVHRRACFGCKTGKKKTCQFVF
jgi:hypothetical protein